MKEIALFLTLVFTCCSIVYSQASKKQGLVPCEPKALFAGLPSSVEGWRVAKSSGSRDVYSWMECRVERVYVQADDGGDTGAEVVLSIKDTGKYAGGELAMFDGFKPQKNNVGGFEYTYLAGNPAIVFRQNEMVNVELLIDGRFVVSIRIKNLPERAIGQWYRKIDSGRLSSIKDGPIVPMPTSFVVMKVDELDPKKNSKYTVSIALEDSPDGTVEEEEEYED